MSSDANYQSTYQALKLDIMKVYPLKQWFDHLDKLDDYHDRHFVSLKEAHRLDENNKNGTQFIAPISSRDRMMIIPGDYSFFSKDLSNEQQLLHKEYKQKNGITDEILSQKRTEFDELSNKYWNLMNGLPQQEIDSLNNLHQEERKMIHAKYKAMEQLTDEERAEFKIKFEDLEKQQMAQQKANREEMKVKVLRKLEQEVKVYIKWAKSQMGS